VPLVLVTTLVRLQRRLTRRRQTQGALGHLKGQPQGWDALDQPQLRQVSQDPIRTGSTRIGLAASDVAQAVDLAGQ
jgi:hypothetical protein